MSFTNCNSFPKAPALSAETCPVFSVGDDLGFNSTVRGPQVATHLKQ